MGKQESERQKAWVLRQREREALWRKRVGTWRQSGQSQAAYCRQQGLSPADFSWWKHELARRDGLPAAGRAQARSEVRPRFLPLQVAAVQTPSACVLELSNGRCLRIERGVEPGWVAELAAALEKTAPC